MSQHRDRRAAEIEAEITRVRRDMDTTLTAIENRLTTDGLMDQGMAYLKQSGAREFVSNLGTSVKYNPLPVSLVGIGLAWLMASGRRGTVPSGDAYGYEGTSSASRIKERAGEAMTSVSETAASARDRLSETAASTKERISRTFRRSAELGTNVRDRARTAVDSTRRQAERARRGFDYMVHEQPLVLGALGLAVGAAIAAAVPRTRQEDEWMGEARDRFADQLKETGEEQLEKARHVASAAGEAAAEEASRQRQSPTPAGT